MTGCRRTEERPGPAGRDRLACGACWPGCADEQERDALVDAGRARATPAGAGADRRAQALRAVPLRQRSGRSTRSRARSWPRCKSGCRCAPRAGLKPDMNRRREALEGFPLDTIRMVGHMTQRADRITRCCRSTRSSTRRASATTPARISDVITSISETEVALKELVQDAAGDWVERRDCAALQEGRHGGDNDIDAATWIGRLARRFARWRPSFVVVPGARRAPAAFAQSNSIESRHQPAAGQHHLPADRIEEPADHGAARLLGLQPAAHCLRLHRHRQPCRQESARAAAGRRAQRRDRPVGRALAGGAQSQAADAATPRRSTATRWWSRSTPVATAQAAPPRRRRRTASPRPTATASHALRDIDFRRGKNGEGRVVVDLSDSDVGVDIRQQGQAIVVDFHATHACPRTCAAVSTSATSARRSQRSARSSRATTRAW